MLALRRFAGRAIFGGSMARVIFKGWRKPDDPIYKTGWSIHIAPLSPPKSKAPSKLTPKKSDPQQKK